MEVRPVLRCEAPAYPTRDAWLDQPAAFGRYVPRTWRMGKGFAGAVALFVLSHAGGCGQPASVSDVAKAQPEDPFFSVGELSEADENIQVASDWTRSIFEDQWTMVHFGCVAIMPPSWTPEDQAIQTVNENGGGEAL